MSIEKKYWSGLLTMTLDDWRQYIIDTMPYYSEWNSSSGRYYLAFCSDEEFMRILKEDFNTILIEA